MPYGYQTWSAESLVQVKACQEDDLHGGQRSADVKYSKLCYMAIKLCQKIPDDDDTFTEVKGQERSNVVNNVLWLPHLVRSTA